VALRLWFRAMYHLTQSKQGISSIELGRRLGVTQTTAWKIKHRLKQVMLERDAKKRLVADAMLLKWVPPVHASSRETYGAPRVRAQLRVRSWLAGRA